MITEKKGLSKREKVLIIFMAIFGSLALMVVFVILPLYEQLGDKNTEFGYLQTEEQQILVKIATENVARENYDRLYETLLESSERFLNPSLSNEIGRMLTSLCENHGLQPISQQLSAPRDYAPAGGSGGASGGNGNGEGSVFLIVSASMVVRGSYVELKDLLDAVEDIEYFRVTRVSFGRSATETGQSLDRISLNFEVTMLNDSAIES